MNIGYSVFIILYDMREKIVYEAPEAEALACSQEVNFCDTVNPSVSVQYGGSEGQFFDDETDW